MDHFTAAYESFVREPEQPEPAAPPPAEEPKRPESPKKPGPMHYKFSFKAEEADQYELASNCRPGEPWTVEKVHRGHFFIMSTPEDKVEHLKPRKSPKSDEVDYGKRAKREEYEWNFDDYVFEPVEQEPEQIVKYQAHN